MEEETVRLKGIEKNKSTPVTGRQAENARVLNPDPSINPVFQKVAGRNLNLGGGIGMIMRNQVLNAYGAVETHEPILTASEARAKEDDAREAVIAIEMARLAAIKAREAEELVTPVQVPAAIPVQLDDAQATPPPPQPEEILVDAEEVSKPKPKKKKRRPIVDEPEIEEEEKEEEQEVFVSLWEKYADEGPPEVEVEVEVAPAPPPRAPYEFKGPKLYNVLVQVKPKDITRVTEGEDGLELIRNADKYKIITATPKPMNVMLMVKPRSKEKIPVKVDTTLFKNAYTQARPRGYKDLDLGRVQQVRTEEMMNQVTELEIEQSTAASRGYLLREGNVLWPTTLEFTSELAELKIKTYIRNFWKLGSAWMFDVRFIQSHTTNYRKKYIYEVVFSKPLNECPVPPATASVYFILEAQHYSCPDQSMKVHYLLEGNRYPYPTAGIEFREDWIAGIIEDKLRIQNSIRF